MITRLRIGFLLVLAATGCKETVVGPNGSVASVVLEPGMAALLIGDTVRLVAAALDEQGDQLTNYEIVWATSDPSVAGVSQSGLVTALVPGTVTIYAASGGEADSATLTVAAPFLASSISTGGYHTCSVDAGGTAHCWGRNSDGELGVNLVGGSFRRPTLVAGGHAWSKIIGGLHHTCGLTQSGAAYCWGWNYTGQVGDSTTTSRVVPTQVLGAPPMTDLALGYNYSCGLEAAGVRCWGSDWISGYVGAPVLGTLTGGQSHLCGIAPGSQAYCWGWNGEGEVGDSTYATRSSPVPVVGSRSFTVMSSAGYSSCGITPNGTAFCWGRNLTGQLGDGSFISKPYPVAVSGGLLFSAISVGYYHTCGITTAGLAYCWGQNSGGKLGDGTQDESTVPVAVAGGLRFRAISAGADHTCAITESDRVYCWGANASGSLGDGTSTDRVTPVPVSQP
jgi:hypothetical protein